MCRLEVLSGVAVHVDDVPFLVGDDRRGCIGLEEHAVYEFGNVHLLLPVQWRNRFLIGTIIGPCKARCHQRPGRCKSFFCTVNLPLFIDRGEEIGEIPDAL